MKSKKAVEVGYWVFTLALLLPFGAGGVMDILRPPQVLEVIRHLGYPDYFPVLLGMAKVAGVAVLLIPVLPRLREWAYAGFTFNMIAASASHLAVRDPWGRVALPLVLLGLVLGSYALGRARAATSAPPAPPAPAP